MRLIEIKQGPVTMPAGVRVQPDADQLRRRRRLLKHLSGDVYMTTDSAMWKTGELVVTDWLIDKSMVNHAVYVEAGDDDVNISIMPDVAALTALSVKDLLPKIAEMSMDELDELEALDSRKSILAEIEKARASLHASRALESFGDDGES